MDFSLYGLKTMRANQGLVALGYVAYAFALYLTMYHYSQTITSKDNAILLADDAEQITPHDHTTYSVLPLMILGFLPSLAVFFGRPAIALSIQMARLTAQAVQQIPQHHPRIAASLQQCFRGVTRTL